MYGFFGTQRQISGGSANIDKIAQPNCHPAATRKSLQHSEKTIPGIEESLKQIR